VLGAVLEAVREPPVERQVELAALALEVLIELAPGLVEPLRGFEYTR
jgi:hypothetical protein